MSHPEKPTVKLTLDGTVYELLFDFEAIAEAEDITDRPLVTGLRSRDITTPSINLVRAMFFATAHSAHPKLTLSQAKTLVTRKNLPEVWGKVLEAWVAAQAEPSSDEEAKANPPQGQS